MRRAVDGQELAVENSAQTWVRKAVTTLGVSYCLSLTWCWSPTSQIPHCTGPQLIKILHYPTILRGYEKPLEPIHARVTLKNFHVLIYIGNSSVIETAEAAIITCSSNARAALSEVFLYTVQNRSPSSPWGLYQPAHHSWAWGICLQSNSALPSLHTAGQHPQPAATCARAGFLW